MEENSKNKNITVPELGLYSYKHKMLISNEQSPFSYKNANA